MAANNADFACTFSLFNTNGAFYDLTGADLIIQFRPFPGPPSPNPTATASTASGGIAIISPSTSGQFSLNIPYATMQLFTPRQYAFDIIQNVSPTSRIFLGGGVFNVTAGITEAGS